MINASLSSVPLYMLSFYELPKGVQKRLDFFRARFLWQDDQGVKKYHLVNWPTVCLPKDQGGLGVLDLRKMNMALLGKWLWRLETEQGIWQDVLRAKYLSQKTLVQRKSKPGDSQFWKGVMGVKDAFYQFCEKKVGDGKNTLFLEDSWIGGRPLADQFPLLYNISLNKMVLVAKVLSEGLDNFRFRRTLTDKKLEEWISLNFLCKNVRLSNVKDTLSWKLNKSGVFSVKSFYRALMIQGSGFPFKKIWKFKIPPRVKVFLWLVLKNSILTKDNLLKRGWKGKDSNCQFCSGQETIEHLFLNFPVARFLWRVVGSVFNLKIANNIHHLFGGWLCGFNKGDKGLIVVGVAALIWALWKARNAACFFKKTV